jgi:hypothetical protein
MNFHHFFVNINGEELYNITSSWLIKQKNYIVIFIKISKSCLNNLKNFNFLHHYTQSFDQTKLNENLKYFDYTKFFVMCLILMLIKKSRKFNCAIFSNDFLHLCFNFLS